MIPSEASTPAAPDPPTTADPADPTEVVPADQSVEPPAVDLAVDNDILIKSFRLGITDLLMPETWYRRRGFLDLARHVVPPKVRRAHRRLAEDVDTEMASLFAEWVSLDPTDEELEVALEIEAAAQARGVPVDLGESQLAAIAALGRARLLATGDKRAIAGLERLLDDVDGLTRVAGRIRCLEHLARDVVDIDEDPPTLVPIVCRDPKADGTLGWCCGCSSSEPRTKVVVVECLESYLGGVTASAPRLFPA